MGSLCGGNTQTSTSQQTTTPTDAAGLKSIFNTVQSAAQTPYTPYGGELTAPVNSQQTAGIAGVNANANTAQPYYNTAAGYAATSGAPLSQAAIQSYMNPYTQSVIDSTQANFNESNGQQQQQVKGNAAMSGALGGDRQAVAQAETARQQNLSQAPVIAGLQQANYQQAQAAAQADRSAAGNAAGTFGNLGTAAQTAGLQGAGAQINAGTLQQTTQQAQDAAQYQQYLQQQAFPYQNAQFLSQYGTPAALAQGSSTSGTQTTPGPSVLGQIAGLGIAAAGTAAKFGAADGGRIEYASGGATPFDFINNTQGYIRGAPGYIPTGGSPPSVSLQTPTLQYAKPQQTDMKPVTDALGGIKNGSIKNPFASSDGGYGATSTDESGVGGIGGLYAAGGLVDAIHHIHKTIKRARGGAVDSMPFRSFADGGDTTLDDRFSAAYQSPSRGADVPASDEPFRLAGPEAMDAWRKGVDQPNPAVMADADQPGPDGSAPNPMAFAGKPAASPAVAAINSAAPQGEPDAEPSNAMAYDSTPGNPMRITPDDAQTAPAESKSPFHLSDKASSALIATGLGMLASRSPFAGVALGEGGLRGLASYNQATTAEQEAADKKITQAQNQKRVDFEAQRIAQSASQFAKTNSLAERRFKAEQEDPEDGYQWNKGHTAQEPIPGGSKDPETIRKAKEAAGTKYVPAGTIMGDDGKLRPAVMEQSTGKIIDAVTGKPPADTDKIVPKGMKAPVSDEDAKALAEYYVKTGDASRLNGMGITGEARQKVQHFVTLSQKENNVSDEELATRKAEWEGRKAGQRTLGVQEAKMGSAAIEAEGAIKQARGVIERLPRTSFLPMNQLIQGYSNKTLNPDQVELYGRAQAIVNTYSAVMSRGANVTTDSARGHANDLLNTAGNAETFNRMLDTMLQEIDMAKHSPAKMREFYRKQYGEKSVGSEPAGSDGSAASPSSAPASPPLPPGVPPNSQWSPSRKKWSPDGGKTIYNADGSKA